jgi:hypothetical protein
MEEIKRKAMRAMRWVTTGIQVAAIAVGRWVKKHWYALVVGFLIGLAI